MRFYKIKIILLLTLLTIQANAFLTDKEYDNIQSGAIFYKANGGKIKKGINLDTKVSMNITGIINRVTVIQKFKNPDDYWTEGKYLFPLPDDASVDTLKMKIGNTIIEGEIQLKKEAKKIYEKAKKEGKKATLVEQHRPNLFTASVANIPPKGEIEVIIEYQQKVAFDNQKYSVKLPFVAAPRYIPASVNNVPTNKSDKNIVQSVEDIDNPIDRPVDIDIVLDPGFVIQDIKSPYHKIKTIENNGKFNIVLDSTIEANKDFELVWFPKEIKQIQAKLYTQAKDNKQFNLLMLTPPSKLFVDNAKKLKREVVFVVDSSGSMSGKSMTQAKHALTLAINRLKEYDKFNVIDYDSTYTTLFSTAQEVNRLSKSMARGFINSMIADGGTVPKDAIKYALKSTNDESKNYLRQVIFITDGQLSNEEEIFRDIKLHLADSKLFTISIGSAPNNFFMKKAANYGKGAFTHIANINEVSQKMLEFFQKIENPSLSDIKINGKDLEIENLYYGESIYHSFVSKILDKKLILSGKIGEKDYSQTILIENKNASSGIDKLWAKDNIDKLMSKYYIAYANDRKTIKSFVEKIALSHSLVSKFTSLVAVDKTPARTQQEILKSQQVKTKIPDGWKRLSIKAPQTATNSELFIMLGLLFMIFSFSLLGLQRLSNEK